MKTGKSGGQKTPQINNLVAKHARKFNKAVTMADRKRAAKRGYRKHRGATHES